MSNAFLFPGQGTQKAGMGKDLYDAYPSAKKMLDRACECLGYDLKAVMFDDESMNLSLTQYAQPAVYVCSAMYLEKAKEKGIDYDYAAGHSLGEYSALYAAGVLSFEEGLTLVNKRAKVMSQQNGKGTMAAVIGMREEELEEIIKKVEGVVIANLNAPMQIVVSGAPEGIEQLESILKKGDMVTVRRLSVSGAFHSPQMEEAGKYMCTEIDKAKFNDPMVPIASNVTGSLSKDIMVIKENLKKQITGQVRWYDSIRGIAAQGIEAFYEVGYGKVLRSMNRLIVKEPKCLAI